MPLFSIIVVHYQGSVPHPTFLRGINSLLAQTFKDFEILCYHDGPLLDPDVQSPLPIKTTPKRFNDYGHSLRDIGIREAAGDYILHFNADNVLYPNALQAIVEEINRPGRIFDAAGNCLDTNDMILFPIHLMGRQVFRGKLFRKPDADFYTILTANPPKFGNIDCLQLVVKRSIWLAEGGWYDRSMNSDGIMYERFCKKYGYRTTGPILGQHH